MTDFAYINARICSMRAQLLPRESIEELLDSSSAQVIAERLLESPYKTELTEALSAHSPIKAMDSALDNHLDTCLHQVARLAGTETDELLSALLAYWDVQCLKTILRGIHSQYTPDIILSSLGPCARLKRHDCEQLCEAHDVNAAVDLMLSWSLPWGLVLRPLMQEYRKDRDLRPLELALDNHRYESVGMGMDGRALSDHMAIRMLMTEAEIRNIVMCLIFLDEEDKPAPLPKSGPHSATVKSLLKARSSKEAIDILANSPYRQVLDKALPMLTQSNRFAMLERLLDEELLNQSRRLSLVDPLSIAVPCHFLRCKRNEVMNLRLIAHGIENDVPKNAITAGLIFVGMN